MERKETLIRNFVDYTCGVEGEDATKILTREIGMSENEMDRYSGNFDDEDFGDEVVFDLEAEDENGEVLWSCEYETLEDVMDDLSRYLRESDYARLYVRKFVDDEPTDEWEFTGKR